MGLMDVDLYAFRTSIASSIIALGEHGSGVTIRAIDGSIPDIPNDVR